MSNLTADKINERIKSLGDSFYQNACKPEGEDGALMLDKMNIGHAELADWGFSHINLKKTDFVLDVGCGGGANLQVLLSKCSEGMVTGIDYSEVSVKKSLENNKEAAESGRCRVIEGSVLNLPFEDEAFDAVTAFETVYFWPEIENSFAEIYRILKKGGTFLICNEDSGDTDKGEKWVKIIKGMTIYKSDKLFEMLKNAGFSKISIDKKEPDWITVSAEK